MYFDFISNYNYQVEDVKLYDKYSPNNFEPYFLNKINTDISLISDDENNDFFLSTLNYSTENNNVNLKSFIEKIQNFKKIQKKIKQKAISQPPTAKLAKLHKNKMYIKCYVNYPLLFKKKNVNIDNFLFLKKNKKYNIAYFNKKFKKFLLYTVQKNINNFIYEFKKKIAIVKKKPYFFFYKYVKKLDASDRKKNKLIEVDFSNKVYFSPKNNRIGQFTKKKPYFFYYFYSEKNRSCYNYTDNGAVIKPATKIAHPSKYTRPSNMKKFKKKLKDRANYKIYLEYLEHVRYGGVKKFKKGLDFRPNYSTYSAYREHVKRGDIKKFKKKLIALRKYRTYAARWENIQQDSTVS